ncbi:MAG TPA: riboflavin synthase [bacterium]|uniref:Riboflavin synthase n=1 Tax=candidate division TA06 bacterium ADurb.Bin417 TaxID=1852828 RepID=A0A1V5MJS4_UNCT6|nr:MAG: Riboflavin synthase [candidate division TA06 bacterium ADurb.Bin417]HNQ36032.1 riboflavin synthase [bacterium]HNS48865.1 riboflavin synthase [bacterium]
MFTGIIQDLGRVERIAAGRLRLRTALAGLEAGESVAVNGVCLTVTGTGAAAEFDLSPETRRRTALGRLRPGDRVNLERALRLSDRLGGHLVTGHVDGVARILTVRRTGTGRELSVAFPGRLRPYLAVKGSVALDGVSLTIAGLTGAKLTVALIPFTLEQTTLGGKRPGETLNIEVDALARYLK